LSDDKYLTFPHPTDDARRQKFRLVIAFTCAAFVAFLGVLVTIVAISLKGQVPWLGFFMLAIALVMFLNWWRIRKEVRDRAARRIL
jgi:uncharacterized membrane protein YfcA